MECPCLLRQVDYRADLIGIDSGGGKDTDNNVVTERIYAITAGRRNCWPIKGASRDMGTDWYSDGFQRMGTTERDLKRKRKAGLGDLLFVNTHLSQCWRESLTAGLRDTMSFRRRSNDRSPPRS